MTGGVNMVMNIIAAVLTLFAVAGSIFAYKLEKSDYKNADSDKPTMVYFEDAYSRKGRREIPLYKNQ